MSILSRIFGGGGPGKAPEPGPSEEYQGFTIVPEPEKTGDGWRLGAVIQKDGRSHNLIRADTLRDRDACIEASVAKARQVIDEQGDRLFG